MAKYTTLTALFTAIANSLRSKTGSTAKIIADDFPAMIDGLSTGGITPTGTKTITTNGSHDVTAYANAEVNVPVGITPSGSLNITENGTYDVTSKASAVVNVPVPAENMVVLPITISTDLGAGTNTNPVIVSGNSFVQQHYADEGFMGILIPLSAESITADSGVVPFVYQSNRALIKTSTTYYSVFVKSNGASSAAAGQANTYKFNAKGYNVSLRADSSGNVNLYVASNFTVKAGNYLLVLLCTD